jgi:hypothetical protein
MGSEVQILFPAEAGLAASTRLQQQEIYRVSWRVVYRPEPLWLKATVSEGVEQFAHTLRTEHQTEAPTPAGGPGGGLAQVFQSTSAVPTGIV